MHLNGNMNDLQINSNNRPEKNMQKLTRKEIHMSSRRVLWLDVNNILIFLFTLYFNFCFI